MGMFDYVRCDYPLSDRDRINKKIKGLEFETKSTPSPCLDYYHVKEDGSLWWKKGLDGAPFGEWFRSSFSGEMRISGGGNHYWQERHEISLFFVNGELSHWEFR
jgi:hypothetical protein